MENRNYFRIAILLGSFIIYSNQGYSQETINVSDSLLCLEMKGKISFQKVGKQKRGKHKVELFLDNTIIDSMIVSDNKKFCFMLERNKYYGIRISKPGYVSRIIGVCTDITNPKYNDIFHHFLFETELIPEENALKLNQDALDFPIAIILFNNKTGWFYYSKKYTSSIKEKINQSQKYMEDAEQISLSK